MARRHSTPLDIKDIAHHLGIGERTVYTYLAAPTFPERQPSSRQRWSGLDPYKPYLLEQWNLGRRQTKELFQEIQQYGYKGSYAMVARYTQQLRQSQPQLKPRRESLNDLPGRGLAPEVQTSNQEPLTARRAAWLILKREGNLTSEEEALLERLGQQPELSGAIALARFAKGLMEDYDAVKAANIWAVSISQNQRRGSADVPRVFQTQRPGAGRGGLTRITTPESDVLWLCKEHIKEIYPTSA